MGSMITRGAGAIASGLAGAAAMTAAHEQVRDNMSNPPRMDLVGMRGVMKVLDALGIESPRGEDLRRLALFSDIATNGLFFALVHGRARPGTWKRGLFLGALAGVAAVTLPQHLGLGRSARMRTPSNQAATVGLYILGGLAAAAVSRLVRGRREQSVLSRARTQASVARGETDGLSTPAVP